MKKGSRNDFVCFIVAACLAQCFSFIRVDLGDMQWFVENEAKGIHHSTSIPGSMYTALLPSTGNLSPLYRDNDVKYKWMGRTDWNYSSTFYMPNSLLSANGISLVCEGLDTMATVYINGQIVDLSDNMFIQSTVSVKDVVKTGNNTILIWFKSAVLEAASRSSSYPYVIPPVCPPNVQHGECHINLIRKEQCSFSWDWGPSFPTQGIWKPIYLNVFNSSILTTVSAVPQKGNDQWFMLVEAFFDVIKGGEVKGQLCLVIEDLGVYVDQTVVITPATNHVKINLTIPKTHDVSLWWPTGYGDQKLFNLNVTFTSSTEKSTKSLQVGFRTVELIQEPVNSDISQGLTFYFKINGLPIFLKGSNWIPADNFQEKITRDQILFLLQSAADVGMNCLRVWGGGVYESDYFYHVADQLGILIWQDLMFSVAMYPSGDRFLNSVKQEVTQQLSRLKHHPSIIIWAGSNENEKALRQNWFGTKGNYSLYYQDFINLYVKTIQPIVRQGDQSRPYLVSSPTDGDQSVKEGYVAKDPGSEIYGDIHFYDYLADQWDPSVFRIPRAATEYGIQSWCNAETLRDVFEEDDYDVAGVMASHRQHHGGGNLEMTGEIDLHMKQPSSSDDKTKFIDFIYLSQINQAMSMRTQTEHYRRHQSELLPDGRGLTMAALYWQLNDIWQAPTWASIDYSGSWKMLHYFSKAFFSPTLVSPYLDKLKDTLKIYMVVDEIPIKSVRNNNSGAIQFHPMTSMSDIVQSNLPLASTFKWMNNVSEAISGHVNMRMYNYNSFKPLFTWDIPYQMKLTAESVFESPVMSLISQSGCPSRSECLLYLAVTSTQGKLMSTSWMSLTYPKDAKLRSANIMIEAVTSLDSNAYKIDLSSDVIALYVWLSTSQIPGRFSDNGFLMISPKISIYFYSQTPTTAQVLKDQLNIKSIVGVQ